MASTVAVAIFALAGGLLVLVLVLRANAQDRAEFERELGRNDEASAAERDR
jgi:hypothetical protein